MRPNTVDLVLYPELSPAQFDMVRRAVVGLSERTRSLAPAEVGQFMGFRASRSDLDARRLGFARARPVKLEHSAITIDPLGRVRLNDRTPGCGRWPLTSMSTAQLLWRGTHWEIRLNGKSLRRGSPTLAFDASPTRGQLAMIRRALQESRLVFRARSPCPDVIHQDGFVASRYRIYEDAIELASPGVLDAAGRVVRVAPLGALRPVHPTALAGESPGQPSYTVRLRRNEGVWKCQLYGRSGPIPKPSASATFKLAFPVVLGPEQLKLVEAAVRTMSVELGENLALPAADFACMRGHRDGVPAGEVEFLDSGSCDLDPPYFNVWPLGRLRLADGVPQHEVFSRLSRRRVKLLWRSGQWRIEIEGALRLELSKSQAGRKKGKGSLKAKAGVKANSASSPSARVKRGKPKTRKTKLPGQRFRLAESLVFGGMIGSRAYSDSPSRHYRGRTIAGSGSRARIVRGGLPSLGRRSR